jgi:hypothetical protein
MAKRIMAKTGEYQNQQNETKGEYTKLGVMLNNNNGDYMLLDPSVNLAGVLIKQNALAAKTGKDQRDMVMISIFDDDNQGQQQAPQSQGGFAPQQQAPQQQGGFNQQQAPQSAQWPHGNQGKQQSPNFP